jgi:hypothetical protein
VIVTETVIHMLLILTAIMCNRPDFRQCRHRFACRVRLMRVLLHRLTFEAQGNVAASCLAETRRHGQRNRRGTAAIELSRRPATSDRPRSDTGEDGEAPHPLRSPNWRSVGFAMHEVGRALPLFMQRGERQLWRGFHTDEYCRLRCD